jgi:hypothetical protein
MRTATTLAAHPERHAIPPRWQRWSWLLPLAVVLGLAVHLRRLPPPPPLDVRTSAGDERFGLDLASRQAIYADIAGHHSAWQALAARFADAWSQHDDYHVHLSRHVLAVASARKLPVEAVFLIYDEGLRRHWTDAAGRTLPATWVPLQPRVE